ncbi:MAG: adenosylcobinamide-phosphate synthase CbiB [Thermodesulfovibrionia bacterium]|nr:adenosylcobinamide-phosphate synthase CbiB [Thermodesulfovibrionia bacterium]
MTEVIVLTAAYVLDLMIGDPQWFPHPVRIIGWEIEKMERILSYKEHVTERMEKFAGILLVIIIISSTYGSFYFLNSFLINTDLPKTVSYLAFGFLIYLTSTTLATNDLIRSGKAVVAAVTAGDKEGARKKLRLIVGRDTKELDDKGILKAVIETLSENTSDGIIAPIFYFAIGGLPLAMTYKAVNTLDSMVGYRNERYKNFGWASARLDDIVNFIPARITGMLIVMATFILKMSATAGHLSLRTMLRDGRKHLSPNSGIPEAAMAGALGIRLGGPSFYAGMLVEKPYIGLEEKSEVKEDVSYLNASENALSIVKITSLLGFGIALMLLYLRTAI